MKSEKPSYLWVVSPLTLALMISAVCALFAFLGGMIFLVGSWTTGFSSSGSWFSSQESVAVIELQGEILDSKKFLSEIDKATEDPKIKAVVVSLNSPGGAVAPSQEMYQSVKKFSKPLVVSMRSVAASGAFYVAMGAEKVFANPGTITGSIGVIAHFVDLSKLYDWAKIHRYTVKTGRFKDLGSEYRSMSQQEEKLLQDMMQNVLAQFKKAIVHGRNLPLEKVDAVADGRIFSGEQALDLGLVDYLGGLSDAIDHVAALSGMKDKPNVIYLSRQKKLWLDLLKEDTTMISDIISFLDLGWLRSKSKAGGLYFLMS